MQASMKLIPIILSMMLVGRVASAKDCASYEDCIDQKEWGGGCDMYRVQKAIAIELHEIKDLLKSREK